MRFGQVYEKSPGSGDWYIRFPSGGRTASGRTSYTVRKVSSQKAGRQVLKEIRLAQLRGTFQVPRPTSAAEGMSLAEALEGYIRGKEGEGRTEATLSQYRIILARVNMQGLGKLRVCDVDAGHVTEYLAWRRRHVWRTTARVGGTVEATPVEGATASNVVLARERGLLASLYKSMLARGVVEKNPVHLVKPPRKPQTNKRPFEPEEAKRFLEACSPELRPIALCGFYTGLGGRELIRLRWSEVSFARSSISIVRQKTGRLVHIALHPHLEAELRALKEQRAREGRIPSADECCFLSRYGRTFRRFPRTGWNAAIRRTGLEGRGLTPHAARRTFATFYPGTDRDCQEILGHRDLATTLVYRNARSERMRDSIRALDYGFEAGKRTPDVPTAETGA